MLDLSDLERERAKILEWLAHPEQHFPVFMWRLGIADALAEEALILLEMEERKCV
jgi:hypothetical protein